MHFIQTVLEYPAIFVVKAEIVWSKKFTSGPVVLVEVQSLSPNVHVHSQPGWLLFVKKSE